jgi:elongation factor Ts
MEITAKDVQELRNETGLGVMDIKKALEEAKGDKAEALKVLAAQAGAKMEKRAGRATGQGRVGVYLHGDGKSAVMVEVDCETDFVAKNDDFNAFIKELTLQIISMKPETVEVLLEQEFVKDPSKKVSDLLKELVAKTGENIVIKRFIVYQVGQE